MPDEHEELCGGCGEDLTHYVNGNRYSNAAIIEIRGVYDGGLFYAHHPNNGGCGYAWSRWDKPTMSAFSYRGLKEKATPFINRWNQRYYDADPARAEDHGHSRPE